MNGMMFGGLARMLNGQAPQFGFRAMFNKQPGFVNDSGMAPDPYKQPGYINDSGMGPMPNYGPKNMGLSVDNGMGPQFGPNATLGQMMPPGAYQPDLTRQDRHDMRLGGLMSYYRGNV